MSGHEQRPGDWRFICAYSGFKGWASESALDWRGQRVLKRFLGSEGQRHPQETAYKPPAGEGRVPWTQPGATDVFLNSDLDYEAALPRPHLLNGQTTSFGGFNWIAQNHSTTSAISSSSILKSPNFDCWRFQIAEGDEWPGDIGDVPAKERSELAVTGNKETLGTDYWAAWSFRYSSPTWDGVRSLRAIVGQLHPAGPYLPNWNLEVQPSGVIALKTAYDVSPGLNSVTQTTRWTSSTTVLDRWTNIVARWNNTSSTLHGVLQLWVDGDPVYSNTDIQMGFLNDTAGPYWKFGAYRQTHTDTVVAEYANMRHGTTSLGELITAPLATPPGNP